MVENGRIPSSDLVTTYLWYPGTTNGRRLTTETAPYAEAMALAFYLEFNKPMYATDGYRDLATQWVLYRKYLAGTGAPAATPGTSNHGLGNALDLGSNINVFSSAEHEWVVKNGPKFGWDHPYWARQGGGREEAWHFDFVGGGTKSPRIERPGTGEVGLGSQGDKAERVQVLLNQRLPGDNLVVDGDFGLASAVAVVRFQKQQGMLVSGRVGPITLARLENDEPAPAPDTGRAILEAGTKKIADVKTLQAFLNTVIARKIKVDGDYGNETVLSVKQYQRKVGITATGKVGPVTHARLVKSGIQW